jgi:Tfp pilus assembly protein PilP
VQPQVRAAGELPDISQMRLVGVLRDRTHGLALLDTPDGATTVASGQQLGAERVTRLDALGITLARGDTTRTLALAEAS